MDETEYVTNVQGPKLQFGLKLLILKWGMAQIHFVISQEWVEGEVMVSN